MIIPTKTYEKPASGLYNAILADIVDLGIVSTVFNGQTKSYPAVRFVWFVNANGKDGKQLQVSARYNVSNLHEKSNIYKALKMILNAPPAPNLDIDTLIGSVRQILVNTETKPDGKEYANIMGILPAPAGTVVPIPQDFVMDRKLPVAQQAKNRPTQTVKPAQQAAAPAAAPASVAQAYSAPTVDLAAQIAALQAQLASRNTGTAVGPTPTPAPAQGTDIAF